MSGDLSTLYENTIDLHNLLAKNFSKFEVDKSKLEYELGVLENKLKEMILLYSKNGFLSTVYDVFDDTTKVDVESTTADVDIKKHYASIPEVKNTSRKMYPEASVAFAVLPEIEDQVEMMPISGTASDALNDSMNSTWQQLILSELRHNVGGYYFIDFKEKQTMNRISVSLLGVKPTLVRIEFSPDNGTNWFSLPYHEEGRLVADEYSFDFPTLEMDKMRILFLKSEPDDQSTAENFTQNIHSSKYKYIIGLKHIGLYQLDYPPNATLVSTPLKVEIGAGQNFSINKVSLSVEEDVPAATDIKYSIAIPPEEGKEVEWKAISPVERSNPDYDQIIDFRNITNAPAMKMSIAEDISIGEYELESLYANGIKFYKIGEIEDKKIINTTERLYVGRDSWGIKRFAYKQPDHQTHLPSMDDWIKNQNFEYDFVKIEDGKPGLLLDRVTHTEAYNYMITSGILSEKYQEVDSAIPASTDPIAIYVNGDLMYQGIPDSSTKVPFKFDYGWNEIVVLLYTRSIGSANGVTLDLNLDVRKYGANIYSKANPLELVSLHDLRYNIKSNDRTKYALYEVNDITYVVLNHAVPGLEYDFFFNYVEGDIKDTILFKAEFTKNEQHSSVSPKLKSYRLRFS
ncbi:hypothetical protein QO179_24505 [Bacillus stercoris]|nr:hypothetical protein [Bacillus stercoris]